MLTIERKFHTLAPYRDALIAQWRIYDEGVYRIHLSERTQLTLVIGDIADAFDRLILSPQPSSLKLAQPRIDAWFFDGFNPAKNPDMWAPELFQKAAGISSLGATAATFSSARVVKDALTAGGFSFQKARGFGRKRDILVAQLSDPPARPITVSKRRFNAPWHIAPRRKKPSSVAIIGAGLAGATTAAALAKRGIQVTVFERAKALGAGGSGNPQGVLYTKLSHRKEPATDFALTALSFAMGYYRSLLPNWRGWNGVIQLDENEKTAKLHQQIAERFPSSLCEHHSAETLSTIAGVPISKPGLFIKEAGWLRPQEVVKGLLARPNITLKLDTAVDRIEKIQGGFRIKVLGQAADFDQVILASAIDANSLLDSALPIKAIRGQVDVVKGLNALKTTVTGDGYAAPNDGGVSTVGASFNTKELDTAIRDTETQDNLARVSQLCEVTHPIKPISARASFRCATPDYLPIVGQIAPPERFRSCFSDLAKDRKAKLDQLAPVEPGLWVNVGHGSRGLCSTPLCAELIASEICNEFLPMDAELGVALSPQRFLVRDLIRGS